MKLVEITKENKRYYSKEFIHGFNTGAKIQYEADSKERRGRWEWNNEDEFFYSCSNCGHKAYGNTAEIVSGLYNYCPNCGAKMEVKENEND